MTKPTSDFSLIASSSLGGALAPSVGTPPLTEAGLSYSLGEVSRLARQCGVYPIGKMLARQGIPIREALAMIQCNAPASSTARPQPARTDGAQKRGQGFTRFSALGEAAAFFIGGRSSTAYKSGLPEKHH